MILILILIAALSFLLYKFIVAPYKKCADFKSSTTANYFYPILGIIKLFLSDIKEKGDILAYYKELPKTQPNATMHVANVGSQIHIQLLGPKIIKEFYSLEPKYVKMPELKAFHELIGTGLIRAEGALWKSHRKTLSGMFHYEFIKQNIPLMVNTTREFLDKLGEGDLNDVKIMDEIQKITGEIVGRIFFGENLNGIQIKGEPLTMYLADLMGDIFGIQNNFVILILRILGLSPKIVPRYRQVMMNIKEFRAVCFKIVQDRKLSQEKKYDMLGLLLETQTNPNKEDAFSDEDIVNEFITFFAAGMDTTGHALTMMLYLLWTNPQFKDNFKHEVNNVYGKEKYVDQDSLNQMEFTHAFLKETLRFYPPAPGLFSRTALEDHYLLDVPIKKGMIVRPNPMFNYFHPQYFEDPYQFKPERWLNKSFVLDPFVYIPFSAGPRNCIGQHLSVIETKIILAEFLKKFDFEIPKDYKLTMTMKFLYEPVDKLPLKLIPK